MRRPRFSPTGRLLLQVALVVLAVSGTVSVIAGLKFKDAIDSANGRNAGRLHTAQVNGCYRTNARQVVANKNELATFRLNTLFAQALTRPPQRPQTNAERRLTRDFRNRLLDTVASETWTPINQHCKTAPTAVLLPVSFSKRQPSQADLPRISSK